MPKASVSDSDEFAINILERGLHSILGGVKGKSHEKDWALIIKAVEFLRVFLHVLGPDSSDEVEMLLSALGIGNPDICADVHADAMRFIQTTADAAGYTGLFSSFAPGLVSVLQEGHGSHWARFPCCKHYCQICDFRSAP